MYEITFYIVIVASILGWIIVTAISLLTLKFSLLLYVIHKKLNVWKEKIRCHVATIAGN